MAKKRKFTKKQLAKFGIFFDDHNMPFIDGNVFANHIYREMPIICDKNKQFYIYGNGRWEQWSMLRLKKYLYDYICKIEEDAFSLYAESGYIEILARLSYSDKPFNQNRRYLNLKNGILDLKNLRLREHTPNLRSTIQVPIEYDPKADCPVFKQFLRSTLSEDDELVAVVQEMMGYCLTPEMKAQCCFIFLGDGSNGKSLLFKALKQLVGKGNYSTVPLSNLSHSFSRATLENKLLNISSENESGNGRKHDTQYLKAISGGDEVQAEYKGKDVFVFQPICKLVFSVNSLPNFSDKSHGLMRRLKIIPLERIFDIDSGTADIHLEEKLDGELPGILNFAIEGLLRLRKNDYRFTHSSAMDRCLHEYEELIDPYKTFVEELIVFEGKTSRKEIYSAFTLWAKQNKHKNLAEVSPKRFWVDFRALCARLGHPIVDSRSGDRYVNLSLNEEAYKELRGGNSRVGYFN